MKFLDIGDVAAKTGIQPSALRYYEDIGLISSVSRHGLRRQYEADVLLQLKLVVLGKTAGFSLREIARMFGKGGKLDLPRKALRQKAEELDLQIRQLATLSNTMRHVADCPAPSHLECPTFRRLLNVAVKRGEGRKAAVRKAKSTTRKAT
jgi:DNA-binding transcriptional MerR regulator